MPFQDKDFPLSPGRLVVNALPALRRLCDSVPAEQPQIADTTNHKGAHDENDKHASKP